MRNKILAALIPVAAFAALAGTGFGSWYFATSGATATTTANVAVTSSTLLGGSLSLTALKAYAGNSAAEVTNTSAFTDSAFSLVLDQKHDAYWSLTGVEDANAEAAATASDVAAQFGYIYTTYTMNEGIPEEAREAIRDALNVTLKFEITAGLDIFNKYLSFGSSVMEKTYTKTSGDTVADKVVPGVGTDGNADNTMRCVYPLPVVTWVTDMKPKTKSAYDTMVEEMKAVKFQLSASAVLADY